MSLIMTYVILIIYFVKITENIPQMIWCYGQFQVIKNSNFVALLTNFLYLDGNKH